MNLPPIDMQPSPGAGESVWASLSGHLDHDIAQPLTSALRRVVALAESGRIDRAGLSALRTELTSAQRAALISQRLGAITNAARRRRPASVDLAKACAQAARRCEASIAARGIEQRTALTPAVVRCDADLLATLLDTIAEWLDRHAVGRIEWRCSHDTWPANARLTITFHHQPADLFKDPEAPCAQPALDSLEWLLIQRIASRLGAVVQRTDTASNCRLSLTFLCTEPAHRADTAIHIDEGVAALPTRHKPLAGYHLLLLGRRDVRALVRGAVAGHDLLIDHASGIEEAQAFCAGGLPHAIVYDEMLAGERLDTMRDKLHRQAAALVFIEVSADDATDAPPPGTLRIARTHLATHLAGVLQRAFYRIEKPIAA
jgi:hypothetical protein